MTVSHASSSSTILEGLEVVEITTNVAGPFAGKLLADNGANVTKVEPPWGEPFRNRALYYDTHESDEFTYRFLQYNDGKDSIAIDLKTAEGVKILWRLLDEADVFLENSRAGALADLGFPWEELKERNPDLVYCSITGYGKSGSFADRPAYDTAVQGISGLATQVGELKEPETIGIPLIDHSTGLYAVISILLALVHRGITGSGQRVEIAMIDVAVSLLGHAFAEYSVTLSDSDITPGFDAHFKPSGVYACKDDYSIILITPDMWPEFAEAIGKPEFTDEGSQFSTNAERVSNAEALKREIEAVFRDRTVDEWIAYFDDVAPRVPMAPVTAIRDIPHSDIVVERGMAVHRSNPEVGEYVTPGPAIRFSDAEMTIHDVPKLGAHSTAILESLGYSADDISALRDAGIVT